MILSGWQSGPIASYMLACMSSFSLASSVDRHSVIICFIVRVTPHVVHSVGGWFFIRCPCVMWLCPILSRFIIISVFLDVSCCGQGFIFCLISRNFVFWFSQWFCHIFCVIVFMCFFVSNIVLYFCLGASDVIAFFACWSARSFPWILQCPGVQIIWTFLFWCFRFSIWFMMLVAMSLVWNIFWILLMVLRESVNILKFWCGLFSICLRADVMATAPAV